MDYPLGPPIRKEKKPEPEWRLVNPDNPYLWVNQKGQYRNTRPPPTPRQWF